MPREYPLLAQSGHWQLLTHRTFNMSPITYRGPPAPTGLAPQHDRAAS